jgi:hypothetical protein
VAPPSRSDVVAIDYEVDTLEAYYCILFS